MKRILILLLLLLNICLASALTAPYDIYEYYYDGYITEYIIYYTSQPEMLYEYIENDTSRMQDTVSFPNYTMVEFGDNYYSDTYLSGAGRIYHTVFYGEGFVIDAAVYRAVRDYNLEYKPICVDHSKGHGKEQLKEKKHRCNNEN